MRFFTDHIVYKSLSILLIINVYSISHSCEYPVPWIGEDLAKRVMEVSNFDSNMPYNIENEPSIITQVKLWSQINKKYQNINIDYINRVAKKTKDGDNEILFLINILYRMFGEEVVSGTKYNEEYFQEWLNNYLINNERQVAIYHLILGEKADKDYISEKEMKYLNLKTIDADILRYSGRKKIKNGAKNEAHSLFISSIESGSYYALYDLIGVEFSIDSCYDRAKKVMLFINNFNLK